MDMLSGAYDSYLGQISSSASSIAAQNAANKDYSKANDEKLMNACKQFEEYFVEQVYKEAQKTIMRDDEDESPSSATLRSYNDDMMAQHLAKALVNQKSLGLAQSMYEQMKRSQGIDPSEI